MLLEALLGGLKHLSIHQGGMLPLPPFCFFWGGVEIRPDIPAMRHQPQIGPALEDVVNAPD
jgi:hypothetical protein